ncbi:MAG: GIY-YIG nuclease family protein [Nitrospirota bacterium]
MGLYWHRKYITNAQLIGIYDGNEVDFAYQSGVYALYNSKYTCVYIGQAGSGDKTGLYSRLYDHTRDQLAKKWTYFSWFGFYSVNSLEKGFKYIYSAEYNIKTNVNELMNIMEAMLIGICEPNLNRKRGNDINLIEEYEQKTDFK